MNETKRLIFKVDRLKKKHGSLEAINVKKLEIHPGTIYALVGPCLLYTSPSPRDRQKSRMPSSA